MSDYTAIDAALIQRISEGWNEFPGIFAQEVRAHAETIAGWHGEAFRVVDRRLQALRKAGRITYSRKTGWAVKDGYGANDQQESRNG